LVLSEYWKRLEENFRNKIISAISQNDENFRNIFHYSEWIIASTEANDNSEESSDVQLFAAGKCKGVAILGGHHALLTQKPILLNFMDVRRDFDLLHSLESLGDHF
jgi:hypothetical protein